MKSEKSTNSKTKFDINKINISKLQGKLEKELDSKRYDHTLGVAYTAAAMAMRYHESVKKAQIAGLLHDCAKCLSDSKKISLCEKNNIPITDVERRNPGLIHAKLGGFLAKKEYNILDEDILNAIINHTTGRPNMSTLEKIVFIADFIEPGRKNAPNLERMREIAFEDLDQAMVAILESTFQYLRENQTEIDDASMSTYEYYKK